MFKPSLWLIPLALMTFTTITPISAATPPAPKTPNPIVKFQTTMGNVFIELFPDKAPISVQNFLEYVDEGFYDGTIFHRIIPGFMNQGGGFLPGLIQKNTKPPIKNEADNGLLNKRGTIAMARTNLIDSATCQFFINTADNGFLDHKSNNSNEYGYAVFGKVIDGMDVVEKMSKVTTKSDGPYSDIPMQDIVITKAIIHRGKLVEKPVTADKTLTK